jgi:hypothetical protein
VKNLDTVLREKEEQVETLQKEIEALKFVAVLLKEESAAADSGFKTTASASLASAPAPTHVMQSSSSGASFEREPGGYLGASSGLKQFP